MTPRARGVIVFVAALVSVTLTARLGLWQLDRAGQKQALQSQRDARRGEAVLMPAELARNPLQALGQHERRIALVGRWLPQHQVFLDNRQMDGRPGFFHVMPLELAPGDVVLVQRGWAPRDGRDRAALPAVPTEAGSVSVSGVVAAPPGRLYALGSADTGVLRQNLDLESFGRETGLSLRPLSIRQDAGPPDDGLRRQWAAPAADVHKHHGYAFQWFALSSLLTGLYVWFQVLGPWWRRRSA